MPVGQIAHITSLKPRQVRECLLIMIQHNIAVYAEAQERSRIVTYYEVNRTELLHRSMIPKVLHSTQEWFERDGASIAHAIMTHGKLTIGECLNEITAISSSIGGTVAGRPQAQRKAVLLIRLYRSNVSML